MTEQGTQTRGEQSCERRGRERARIALSARYLGEGGEEVSCETLDVSATGVSFRTARPPRIGETVVAYIRELGRVQGKAVRYFRDGFAMSIVGTDLKTQRLADKIAQLAAAPDRRLSQRQDLKNAQVPLKTRHGHECSIEIVDISTEGVAFRTQLNLSLGEPVEIGGQAAVVARLFDGGASASFR